MEKEKFQPLIERGVKLGKYPEFLYKYKTLESAIQSLEGPTIYASSITKFNDPYEGHFQLDPHSTTQEWLSFLRREAQKMPDTEIMANATQLSSNPDKEEELLAPIIREELESSGVFCLSRDWNSILNWAYYSEEHKGICIEYKPILEEELCDKLLPVNYSDDYVKFNYLREPRGVLNAIIQKAACWAPENEIRVIKPHRPNEIISINPQAVTAVILGCRFEEGIKDNPKRQALLRKLIAILRDPKYNHLQIKQCVQKSDKYELITKKITLPMLEALLPPKKCIFGDIWMRIKNLLHLK